MATARRPICSLKICRSPPPAGEFLPPGKLPALLWREVSSQPRPTLGQELAVVLRWNRGRLTPAVEKAFLFGLRQVSAEFRHDFLNDRPSGCCDRRDHRRRIAPGVLSRCRRPDKAPQPQPLGIRQFTPCRRPADRQESAIVRLWKETLRQRRADSQRLSTNRQQTGMPRAVRSHKQEDCADNNDIRAQEAGCPGRFRVEETANEVDDDLAAYGNGKRPRKVCRNEGSAWRSATSPSSLRLFSLCIPTGGVRPGTSIRSANSSRSVRLVLVPEVAPVTGVVATSPFTVRRFRHPPG